MMSMINGGTTVLYVSHSLESIRELCTKVVWLEHGKIKMVGDPDEMCDAYYYYQMGETIETARARAKKKQKEKKAKNNK